MNEKYSQKEFSSTMVNYVYIFVYSATVFLLAAVRVPDQVQELVVRELHHPDATQRINAILRFGVLWRHRWQVWPRMEDGANMFFKVTTQKHEALIQCFLNVAVSTTLTGTIFILRECPVLAGLL